MLGVGVKKKFETPTPTLKKIDCRGWGLKPETGNFLRQFQNSKSSNRCRSVYGTDIITFRDLHEFQKRRRTYRPFLSFIETSSQHKQNILISVFHFKMILSSPNKPEAVKFVIATSNYYIEDQTAVN